MCTDPLLSMFSSTLKAVLLVDLGMTFSDLIHWCFAQCHYTSDILHYLAKETFQEVSMVYLIYVSFQMYQCMLNFGFYVWVIKAFPRTQTNLCSFLVGRSNGSLMWSGLSSMRERSCTPLPSPRIGFHHHGTVCALLYLLHSLTFHYNDGYVKMQYMSIMVL